MEEVNSSNSPRRRRRHRRPKKKNIFEKINTFFISDGISYSKEKKIVKKRKKLLKKSIEYMLWGIVVFVLIMAVIDMLSEVSIKDIRNDGKNTRKRTFIYPEHNHLQKTNFTLIKFAYS